MPEQESNNKNKKDQHPVADEPGFMAPQKPVLEEPLEENEMGSSAGEAMDPRPKNLDSSSEEETLINQDPIENDGILQLHGNEDEARSPKAPKPFKRPYSPYFPRGVYEDAQAVEEYYGRSIPIKTYHSFNRELDDVSGVMLNPIYRAFLLLFAILMIIGLIFLALTGRIAFPFL